MDERSHIQLFWETSDDDDDDDDDELFLMNS